VLASSRASPLPQVLWTTLITVGAGLPAMRPEQAVTFHRH